MGRMRERDESLSIFGQMTGENGGARNYIRVTDKHTDSVLVDNPGGRAEINGYNVTVFFPGGRKQIYSREQVELDGNVSVADPRRKPNPFGFFQR